MEYAGICCRSYREVITKGADMLGIKVEELVEETILAMQKSADVIGLRGTL